jgi:hypothetical protein
VHPDTRKIIAHMKDFGLAFLGRSIKDMTFGRVAHPPTPLKGTPLNFRVLGAASRRFLKGASLNAACASCPAERLPRFARAAPRQLICHVHE